MIGQAGAHSFDDIENFASLVLRLRGDGIADSTLLSAVEQTPRRQFAPAIHADIAYGSRLIPIECGAFMEGADLMVRLLHALDLQPGQRVLEVGTGSGFATAIMARIADRVVTIERYRTLIALARQRLEHFGLRNVTLKHSDGRSGAPGEGTFDRIFVAGAFDQMPRAFVDHLAPHGIMLTGMTKPDGTTVLGRLTRLGNRFERTDSITLPYLPLVPGVAARL